MFLLLVLALVVSFAFLLGGEVGADIYWAQIKTSQSISKTSNSDIAEENGIVYFIPQIGKSGSSALRNMFNSRGKWHGIPRADDQNVAIEISRKCGKAGAESNNEPTENGDGKRLVGSYYPFSRSEIKWEKFPFFWRLADKVKNDHECINHVIHTSWKIWQGAVVEATVAPGEDRASTVQGWRRPKPSIQFSGPCPSSEAVGAKCRHLVQMRNPIAWIESSFGYFCKDCRDNHKFCGKSIDTKCGPNHLKMGDHETIQSWARKFGNTFTRHLIGGDDMLAGGTYYGGLSPDGWKYPNIVKAPRHVEELLRMVKEEKYCVVALEDPRRLSKIEECLGDEPGFYRDELGYTERNKTNVRTDKAQLDPNVTAELKEILAADVALYNALFPFLTTVA